MICLLPVPNRDTLETILKLLDQVRINSQPIKVNDQSQIDKNEKQQQQHTGGNKMDAFNLAMVFGPNLLKKHNNHHKMSCGSAFGSIKSKHLSNYDKYNLIDDIDSVISITKYLIEHQNLLFTIDCYLHNELVGSINKICPTETNAIIIRKIISQIGIQIIGNEIVNNRNCYNMENSNLERLTEQNINPIKSFNNRDSINSPSSTVPTTLIDESLSFSSYCSSTNELDRILTNMNKGSHNPVIKCNNNTLTEHKPNETVEFIDNLTINARTSRTKLHKITNNINNLGTYINDKNNEFTKVAYNKPMHRVSEPFYIQNPNIARKYSNYLLSMIKLNELKENSNCTYNLIDPDYQSQHYNTEIHNQYNPNASQNPIVSINANPHSPMLLMIQSHQNPNTMNDIQLRGSYCSALNTNNVQNSLQQTSTSVCSNFIDKTTSSNRFNVIGEQETLV